MIDPDTGDEVPEVMAKEPIQLTAGQLTDARLKAGRAFLNYMREELQNNVVIAGGFARDTYMEQDYRDIDLYVPEADYYRAKSILFGDKEEVFTTETEPGSVEYEHQYIVQFTENIVQPIFYERFPALELETHPVNLIAIKDHIGAFTAANIADRYNIGLSQCWIPESGDSWIGYTPAFRRDIMNKQMTVLRTEWGREGTAANIRKYMKKYPDFLPIIGIVAYNEEQFLEKEVVEGDLGGTFYENFNDLDGGVGF